MRLTNGLYVAPDVNDFGVTVSRHLCLECGAWFTVCPPTPWDIWGGCQDENCPSYDSSRDADRLFDEGKLHRERDDEAAS